MTRGDRRCDVSVVTPCLDVERELPALLQSLEEQTLKPREVIFVDGGSGDRTLEILGVFRESASITVHILTEPRLGLAEAFNEGIARATSGWIHLLGADDRYASPLVLETLDRMLSTTDAEIVCGSALLATPDGGLVPEVSSLENGSLAAGMTAIHPATFVRAPAYRAVGGFSPLFRVAMDYEWLTRFEKVRGRGRITMVDAVVVVVGAGGVSHRDRARGYREVAAAQALNTVRSISSITIQYAAHRFFFTHPLGTWLWRAFKKLRLRPRDRLR